MQISVASVKKGVFMSRNEFDASHRCPAAENRVVSFVVYIGDPPICPECHEAVEAYPVYKRSSYAKATEDLRTSSSDGNQELVLKEDL